MTALLATLLLALFPGCSCGGVASEEQARVAYLGVDTVIVRTLALGFDGFNAADSANIPPQSATGEESGTIDVTGQVDQGSSDNKGMRLDVVLVDYSEGPIDDPETDDTEALAILYATADGAPLDVDLQLRGIPTGTLEGTLVGSVVMEGDLAGELELSLSFAGDIEEDPQAAGATQRVEGSTEVTGTATSAAGVFEIDTTI